MRHIHLVLMLSACGNPVGGRDPDARASTDGRGGGDGGGSAGPGVMTIQCDTHTSTVVHANGTKVEQRTYFKLIDNIAPMDDFWIEQCGYAAVVVPTTPPPGCAVGDTCTEGGTAFPTDPTCSWNHGNGSFAGGKPYVNCGVGTTYFDANGNVTSSIDLRYASIRIHH